MSPLGSWVLDRGCANFGEPPSENPLKAKFAEFFFHDVG